MNCYHQYVDDTQLYFYLPSKPKEAAWTLDQCLVSVMNWLRENKLKLNVRIRAMPEPCVSRIISAPVGKAALALTELGPHCSSY